MAVLLQSLCVRLGVATGKDLAQACRAYYSPQVSFLLWILAEIAIAACDLAEVLGSAIGLKLLFGIPLLIGVSLTAADVILLLSLQSRGFRYLEALVITLIALIGGCFLAELFLAQPQWSGILAGFVPQSAVIHNPEMLYLAIGILGATVMPHNLYLHSAIIQTRAWELTTPKKWEAIRFGSLDSTIALCFALFINAAILILAAATFYESGHHHIASIEDAYQMLTPLLGTGLASTLFAIALLASGQNATLTGTLAGQIVMEGFIKLRMRPWLRRLLTRSLAIIPALLTILLLGEGSTTDLLVLSQVILSLQLSFAVIPLVSFTSNPRIMKEFVNPTWLKLLAGAVATLIVGLNSWLLLQMFWRWLH
jgi:manganese transport protein